MAQKNHKVGIEIGYSLDKSSLQSVLSSLQNVIGVSKKNLSMADLTDDVKKLNEEAKLAAQNLQHILSSSWNPKLNQLDLSKVNQQIKDSYGNVKNLQQAFGRIGTEGAKGYNAFAREVLNTNLQLKQSNKLLDEMAVSMANTVKWGITSSIFNTLSGSLQKAWDFSKGLDSSLNDIRIVTGKSADEMARFAKTANSAAKNLGASTRDFTEAALIYYQQGDEDAIAQAKAEITLKTANVTGQDAAEVSEQLTSVWNGYKVSAEEAELYIDKLAAVAATTASDLEELSVGMSKVASAANLMGVDIDQLNATLATVISVTRQAPESVGTAFKTIYARMGDIEAGLDADTTLGSYTEQMKEIAGVDVLTANGELRDMGEVIEEIGGKWQLYSREQQIALSQVMAGTRQYNNLLSLFDNWGMYEDALKESADAAGTLNEQNEIYMDRVEAKLQQLTTETERTYDILFDEDTASSFIDTVTSGLTLINNLLGGLGGGLTSLKGVAGMLGVVFKKQIAGALEQSLENLERQRNNLAGEDLKRQIIATNRAEGRTGMSDNATNLQVEYTAKILAVKQALTNEEATSLINQQKEIGILQDKIDKMNEYQTIFNDAKASGDGLFKSVNAAENVTQEQFAEAIAQAQTLQNEIKKSNDDLDGVLNQLKDGRIILDDNSESGSRETMRAEYLGETKTKAGNLNRKDKKEQQKIFELQEKSQKGLASLQKKFNKDSKEYLKIQEKIAKINNKEFLTEQDIQDINKIQNDLLEDKLKLERKLKAGADGLAEAESGAREKLELEIKARQDIINQQVEQKERQLAISNAVAGLGSFATLTASVEGFSTAVTKAMNGTGEWKDALSSAVIMLPAMISTIKSVSAAVTAFNTLQDLSTLSTIKNVAAKKLEQGATAESVVVEAQAMLAKKLGKKATVEQTAAILVNEGVVSAEALANTKAAVSEEVLTATKEKGTIATLKSAAAWWSHPIGMIIGAIGLAAVAFVGLTSMMKANTEATKESNSKAIERENTRQEELKSNLDLYNSYTKLYDQYKEGKTSKEEMAEAAEDLVELLGREDVVVKTLTGDYEALNEEIQKQKLKDAESLVTSTEKEKNAAQSNVELFGADDKGASAGFIADWAGIGDSKVKDGQYVLNMDFGWSDGDEEKIQDALNSKGLLRDAGDGMVYVNQVATENNAEGLLKLYNEFTDLRDNYKDYGITAEEWSESEQAQHIEHWLEEMQPQIEAYLEAQGEYDAAQAQYEGLQAGFDDIKDVNDFDTKRNAYIEKLKTYDSFKDKTDEEIGDIADEYIAGVSDSAKEFLEASYIREDLADKLGIDQDTINEAVKDMTSEEIKLLASEKDNIDHIDDIDNYVAKIKGQTRGKQIETSLGYTDEALESLMDGKELTEDQIENLKKLEEDYEELGQIQDRNSREYLQKLYEIKQALEDEAIAAKKAVSNAFIEDALQDMEADVELDTEEFREQLKDIAEADYSVLVKVEADIQSDFDGVVGVMENIDEMASKIGEDFIVAAEDLEELNDVFPGILENAQILADGTMQLDREIVASKMAAAQQEVQADTETTVEKLQNQQTELLAKRDAAQQIADLASQMVEGEAMTAEQEGILNNALNTLKQDNAETTSEYEKDTQQDVADTSKINSEAMATNFSGAYKKMAEDSKKWANAAKQNMLVATTGKGTAVGADINTSYSAKGSSGTVTTATKGELKSGDDVNKSTNWADVQAYYSNLAASYNSAAVNVQGKIAEILARNAKFNDRTTGVGTGRGADRDSGGDEAKLLDAEKDIYHDINVELENIANNLSLVESQTEKLVGQDLIDNLAEQYGLLNDQIDKTAEKLAIAHGEQASLQAQLSALGVTFNSDGTIANYMSSFDSLLNAANSNPNDEAAKERFELFEDLVNKYDDLITGTIPELVQSMQDDLDKQMELKLQAFHHEIDLKIDIAEATKDWNEFKRDILDNIDEDDILGGALANLKEYADFLDSDVVQTNTKHIEEIITQLKDIEDKGEGSVYNDNEAQALEDLKTYYDQMIEDLTYLHDKQDEIHESYLDMLDETQEKFDKQIEALETVSSIIEHDKNVINMIYGEEAYGMMSKFFDKQEEVNLQQIDFLNKEIAFWRAERDAAEAGSEAWEKANENMVAAIDSLNSAIEDSIANLQEKYLNAINLIFQNLNNQVTNGMGLDYVETQWDLVNKNADQYLDTVNAIYKTQQLQNKYLDAIEKSDNPKYQQRLNELMKQETDYLREQDKLSEYDLERANLKYEIALKQIALEEAQQNKNMLRLRRDNQGNYTYQYVADNDQISTVQQELADLYNQLYNLDSGQYQSNLEELYDVWVEFQEKMAEAAQINDPEERAAKELLIKEQYGELINTLTEKNELLQSNLYQSTMSHLFDLYGQNTANYDNMTEDQRAILDQYLNDEMEMSQMAFDNLFNLYNTNVESFRQMSEQEEDILMNTIVPQWNSGVQAMIDTIAGGGGFNDVCKDSFDKLDEATKQFEEDLKEIEKNAEQTFEEIANGGNKAYEAVEDLVLENEKLIESCSDEVDAIKGVIDELDALVDKYEEVVQAAKDAATKGYDYWVAENKKNAEVDPNLNKDNNSGNTPAPASTNTNTTPTTTTTKPSLNKGSYVSVKSGTRWYYDSYGNGPSGTARAGTIKYINTSGSHAYNIDGLGWVRKSDIVGYATGGYTGDWAGNDGHLAMLHKKELVLNAHDTDNMLSAITILRDITANLGATLLNKMASISAGGIGGLGNAVAAGGLEQDVTIHAEFPNVTNSREIEDALNNLVNRASQEVHKN